MAEPKLLPQGQVEAQRHEPVHGLQMELVFHILSSGVVEVVMLVRLLLLGMAVVVWVQVVLLGMALRVRGFSLQQGAVGL